ncbi:tumor necrosis factor receptor superfamily member 9 isoform X2 [Rhinatrema bivittatum]|uniref:tumor necrosis factor receptor superfamily member 9 isoform X2 n=1 Tax=Rhinatrema bivittatum TaxID=194408 RepID=UPI00112761D5|nr:tumor necrosis factor receptor superfamily member 9 isoform X2 [Rhinatrema bivittatum]
MEPASSAILHVLLLVLNLRNLLGAVLPCEGERQSCPPGTFYNVRNCSGCIKCPAGSYSSQSDRLSYCHKCRICTGIFKYKTSCSSTQNAQCQCPAGFRCIGENCNRCARNCEAGQEQTDCTACSSGTFTDQINGFCRPWTNCTDQGLVLLANGTSKTDAVCGSSPTVKATVSSAASTSNPVGSVPCSCPSWNPVVLRTRQRREFRRRLADSRAKLEDLSSFDRTFLLQNLPAFLNKQDLGAETDELLSKEGLSLSSYNPSENVKEAFYGKHPRTTAALSLLLGKDRVQYKKRGDKRSDCFWKYCV